MAGEPRHKVESRLIMVETEAAVAFGSGMLAVVFVVEEAFPGVPWVPFLKNIEISLHVGV